MSEYWVSRDKYYCKYCKIYIADDKPSRTHHETGLKHKGNYERFIRDIYKRGEKEKKDKAEEERELARMEAAAQAAMTADDLAAGRIPVASTSTHVPPPRKKPAAPSSSDPFANYSTAESLGFVDPDAALKAEAEVRKTEASIGQWEKVVRPPPIPKRTQEDIEAEEKEIERQDRLEERPTSKWLNEKVRSLDEDEFDPTAIGTFKLKKQRLTLKEEEDIRLEEEEKARIKKEAEREERKRKKAAKLAKGEGWASVDLQEEVADADIVPWATGEEELEDAVKDEETEVDPLAVKGEEDEVKPEVVKEVAREGGGGFKKRKMFGAAAARKKVA